MQVASYALGATVLLIYVHAGTIPTLLPTAFLLCGITLIGIFALLSETHVNDRFEDHYLTVFQVGGHVAIQLGFLLAAPQIGYAFLNVLFLVFGVAALQMTSRQAAVAWTLTTVGVAPMLVLPDTPDGEAVRTLDRLRAIIADLDWSAFSPALKPDETPDTFLARADRALYAAKAQERNRIASA